jgi:hypothetical protein
MYPRKKIQGEWSQANGVAEYWRRPCQCVSLEICNLGSPSHLCVNSECCLVEHLVTWNLFFKNRHEEFLHFRFWFRSCECSPSSRQISKLKWYCLWAWSYTVFKCVYF